jgi:hypothetical protein
MNNEKSLRGEIAEDPTKSLPIGSAIHSKVVGFGGSDATAQIRAVNNWAFFQGSVTGLILRDQNGERMIGTAVMVALGLAVTATHNLRDEIAALERGDVVPYLAGIREPALEIWRVTKVSYTNDDDICFLGVEPQSGLPGDATFYRLAISTRAPRNGEHLNIFGIRCDDITHGDGGISFHARLLASKGTVKGVYPIRHEYPLVPYPCIELSCDSLGGMSGGAVLDDAGFLLGIISRGMTPDGGKGPTFAAWLVPSLTRSLEISWPPGVYDAPTTPLAMNPIAIAIEGRGAVSEATEAVGYKVWFDRNPET